MAHADVHPLRTVHQLQKTKHPVQIVQGLADAHEHNVGNGQAGVQLRKQHLIQHFRRPQAAHQPAQGGSAKGASHGTSHLRGNADAVAVAVAHQDGLHTVSILQPPQILDGTVLRGFLPPHNLRRGNAIPLLQPLAQVLGQIGHIRKMHGPPVQPAIDLPGPKGGLTHFLHRCLQLRQRHGFDVFSHSRLPS